MDAAEISVPSYFLCPISLEIMKDPVTLSTGITFDRESIEKWLFGIGNDSCPVTKQALVDRDLTPNYTLRRLIQAWCTLNAVDRIPTPKPPVDKAEVLKLIKNARNPQLQMKSLKEMRSMALESDRNKRCMESAGAVEFLSSIVRTSVLHSEDDALIHRVNDEALSILYNLQISSSGMKTLLGKNLEFVEVLIHVMRLGNYPSRAYATLLLKPMFEVADPSNLIGLKPETFLEVVRVLRDQISSQAVKAALQILMEICRWGRNRIKAVEAGAVSVLIELLLETNASDKRSCEMMLVVLDQLCGCAEGRSEFLSHSAGLAVVSKKVLRVSHVASEKAVKILSSIARFSATTCVLQEMLQVGVVSKLCLVLQVSCTPRTVEKAKEILRLHSRVWRSSPCIPHYLLTSYPSKA